MECDNGGVYGSYFGLNDSFLGISAVLMPVVGGLAVASLGFPYLGLLGLAVNSRHSAF
jgi:hypothetical protein